jgi:phosphocarrier protein HPr
MLSKEFTLTNKGGLHARPAAGLAQACTPFQSTIKIQVEGKTADAKSLLSLMTLGVSTGKSITIVIEGTDEKEALDKIINYLSNLVD